jgi:hypothetical protein
MIHEILKILDTTNLPELEKQRITTDLLRLFNVVGRSEQLKAFLLFIQEQAPNYRTKQLKPEQVIKTYIESL